MRPSSTPATLRPELGSMEAFDLEMDRRGFISQQVAPVLEVGVQSGAFGKIPIKQLLQTRETGRNSGAGYARSTFEFEPASYATKEQGAEEPVDERDRRIYREYLDAEQVATQRAYDAVLRNAEIRWAAALFNTGTWTGSSLRTDVSVEWDTAASAKPIDDVEAAVRKVWEGTGMWPNALIVNRHTFRDLRNCTQVIERINSEGAGFVTRPADVTVAQLAAVFDLPNIIVAGSAKNSANEGQNVDIANIWNGEYAMVCRVATTTDIREPCIARTFHWAEDGSQIGGTVETYYEVQTRSDIIRVRHEVDEIVMYTEMGHLLENITT